MTATATSSGARRGYRRAIREALSIGVPQWSVAEVVCAFAGENPDLDEFRRALDAYVPAVAFSEGHDDTPYTRPAGMHSA
jgi:hypothetical protein